MATYAALHPIHLHQEIPSMSLTHPAYADLSPARRRLVNLMHGLRYGEIRAFAVVEA